MCIIFSPAVSTFVVVQHFFLNSLVNSQLDMCVPEMLFIASWAIYGLWQ